MTALAASAREGVAATAATTHWMSVRLEREGQGERGEKSRDIKFQFHKNPLLGSLIKPQLKPRVALFMRGSRKAPATAGGETRAPQFQGVRGASKN